VNTTTRLARDIKAGDIVVERDGAELMVASVSLIDGKTVKLEVRRGGIFPLHTSYVVSAKARIRVPEVVS
jgi:hypothetical protein